VRLKLDNIFCIPNKIILTRKEYEAAIVIARTVKNMEFRKRITMRLILKSKNRENFRRNYCLLRFGDGLKMPKSKLAIDSPSTP